MGGVSGAVSIAKAGMETKNLIDQRKADKQSQNNIKRKLIHNINNQRNILDEQLAARRAKVGAMGISSDGSALAVQQGQIKEYHRNVLQDSVEAADEIRNKKLQSKINANKKTQNILTDLKLIQ